MTTFKSSWQTNLAMAIALLLAALWSVLYMHESWGGFIAFGAGIFLADAQTASMQLLAPKLVNFGYWIDGPNRHRSVVTDRYAIKFELKRLVEASGFDEDDFTVTELFVKMYHGSKYDLA